MEPQGRKAELRRELLQQRRSLSPLTWREKSDRLCHRLVQLSLFQSARTVLAYFSIRQEPDLSPLFSDHRRWGFSRCVGPSLVWHAWTPGEPLREGAYGILEPAPDAPCLGPSEIDLILVPAIACDRQGYRLGYGGGFYDRLLSDPQWQGIPTIGIIFDFAFLPELPVDPWDRKLRAVCTETASWMGRQY